MHVTDWLPTIVGAIGSEAIGRRACPTTLPSVPQSLFDCGTDGLFGRGGGEFPVLALVLKACCVGCGEIWFVPIIATSRSVIACG